MSKDLIVSNPSADEFEVLQRMCKMSVLSKLLPDEYNKGSKEENLAKACVVAIKGRELNIPIMQSFTHIHIPYVMFVLPYIVHSGRLTYSN